MSISAILLAIAALCFLLAAFTVDVGEDILLVPLGLMFLAIALLVDRLGVAGRVGNRHD